MKALTIWQPWASFIMLGGKPFEFRQWDYGSRYPGLKDHRIVIHAGARPIRPIEVLEIKRRLEDDKSSLIAEIVSPVIDRLLSAHKCLGVLPLACGLGTAVLGRARRVDAIFKKPDSDRLYQHMHAWPLTDIKPWMPPVECRGAQGFWNWPLSIEGAR